MLRSDQSGTLGVENLKRAFDRSMDARRQQGDAISLFRETEWQASPMESSINLALDGRIFKSLSLYVEDARFMPLWRLTRAHGVVEAT